MGEKGVVVLSKASWSVSPSMLQLTPAVPRGQRCARAHLGRSSSFAVGHRRLDSRRCHALWGTAAEPSLHSSKSESQRHAMNFSDMTQPNMLFDTFLKRRLACPSQLMRPYKLPMTRATSLPIHSYCIKTPTQFPKPDRPTTH